MTGGFGRTKAQYRIIMTGSYMIGKLSFATK